MLFIGTFLNLFWTIVCAWFAVAPANAGSTKSTPERTFAVVLAGLGLIGFIGGLRVIF